MTNPAVTAIEAEATDLPEVYFDALGKYWSRGRNGVWFARNIDDIKLLLKSKGITSAQGREYLTEMEDTLLSIQENNNIRYAGPLAGYPEGVHVIQGKRILVNSGPNLVDPQAGKWPLLGGIFANMLETDEQLQHFYGWLKFGLEHLRERINNPAGVTGLEMRSFQLGNTSPSRGQLLYELLFCLGGAHHCYHYPRGCPLCVISVPSVRLVHASRLNRFGHLTALAQDYSGSYIRMYLKLNA